MKLHMDLDKNGYDIRIGRGILGEAASLFALERKVLVVTDTGVPPEYAEAVCRQCKKPHPVTVPQGEQSKNAQTYLSLLQTMLEAGFDRGDAVVAVGGGMVGDLAGFAAATYMRGIDFYNIPTTLLAQVDSSVGGKTAIDLGHVKNAVGAFYQPKGVLADVGLLASLPPRQLASGFAEGLKMAVSLDADFFASLSDFDLSAQSAQTERFVARAVSLKMQVVAQDEKESGVRRLLNFGHTLGHGMEIAAGGSLFHGECVALGMLPMCGAAVRARLLPIYRRFGLPTAFSGDAEAVFRAVSHDKKAHGDRITAVTVPEPGHPRLEALSVSDLRTRFEAWQTEGSEGENA